MNTQQFSSWLCFWLLPHLRGKGGMGVGCLTLPLIGGGDLKARVRTADEH